MRKLLRRRRDLRTLDYSALSLEPQVIPERPDPRDELIATLEEQVSLSTQIMTRQAGAITAARHLINVLGQRSAAGPSFKLNADDHDDASVEILRHAILDLQSWLTGTEPPKFCLPERTH